MISKMQCTECWAQDKFQGSLDKCLLSAKGAYFLSWGALLLASWREHKPWGRVPPNCETVTTYLPSGRSISYGIWRPTNPYEDCSVPNIVNVMMRPARNSGRFYLTLGCTSELRISDSSSMRFHMAVCFARIQGRGSRMMNVTKALCSVLPSNSNI